MNKIWNGSLTAAALLCVLSISHSQETETPLPPAGQPTLGMLAEQADVVALIQVWDIDYQYVRDFPNKGITTVDVLIGYKGIDSGEQVEILDEGFKPNAGCYYPDRANEGHRFLAFLNRNEKGELHGIGPYCRLPVFVTDDNRYALLAPIDRVQLGDPALIQSLSFNDPHAFIDVSEMSGTQIQELQDRFAATWRKKHLGLMDAGDSVSGPSLLPPDDGLIYTRGVYLSDARQLMFPGLDSTTP